MSIETHVTPLVVLLCDHDAHTVRKRRRDVLNRTDAPIAQAHSRFARVYSLFFHTLTAKMPFSVTVSQKMKLSYVGAHFVVE